MLAQKMEEMLERRRARYLAWAKEFGFDPPPERGGWKMMKAYEEENAEPLHEADILSEIARIHAGHAK